MSGWKSGKVQWFDKTTGEGMVLSDEGQPYYVHWSTIQPRSRSTTANKKQLKEGSKVKFKLFGTPRSQQVETVKEI
jgi:cold shock CspA family protein